MEVIGRSETDEGHSINVTTVFFCCLTSSTALESALWILFIDESMDEQRTAPFPFLLRENFCKSTRGGVEAITQRWNVGSSSTSFTFVCFFLDQV